MKKILTKDEQISKSYDYISNVFNKQGRVMPFELCYGDGSIHVNYLNKTFTLYGRKWPII